MLVGSDGFIVEKADGEFFTSARLIRLKVTCELTKPDSSIFLTEICKGLSSKNKDFIQALGNFLGSTRKGDSSNRLKLLILMEPPIGFEPVTFRLRFECFSK